MTMASPALPHVALVGPAGAGKTAIAKALTRRGYHAFSWATAVHHVAKLAYGHIEKDTPYEVTVNGTPTVRTGRELLQRIGTDAIRRQVDEDFWVRCTLNGLEVADPRTPLVNDDTRFPNEATALARHGFALIAVMADEATRAQRLLARDGEGALAALDHESETTATEIPVHFRIWNDGSATPDQVADALLYHLGLAMEAHHGATP